MGRKELNLQRAVKEQAELLRELTARTFVHKTAILGGVLMKNYMDKVNENGAKIPDFMLEDLADQYSNKVMQQSLQVGTFDNLYKEAWASIVLDIPEHVSVINRNEVI